MAEPIRVQVEADYIILNCQHSSFTAETATLVAGLVAPQIRTRKKVIIDLLGCQDLDPDAVKTLFTSITQDVSQVSLGGVMVLGEEKVEEILKGLSLTRLSPCLRSLEGAVRLIDASRNIEAFLNKASDALISTFTASLGLAPKPENPYFRTLKTEIEIMAATKVTTRYFEGTLSLAFSTKTFLQIMSRMFSMEFTAITAEIADGAAELSNFIIGQIKSTMNDAALELKLGMPSGMREERVRLFLSKFPPTVVRPFTSEAGDILLLFSVTQPTEF